MRNLLLLFVVTALFEVAAAQTISPVPAPKKLFWSTDPACGTKNASITPEDKFVCSSLIDDNRQSYRFEYNGLTLTARLYISGTYFVAETDLENKSGQPKPFDVQDWMIVYFESEESFNAGQKPLSGANPVKVPFVTYVSKVESRIYQNDDMISDLGKTILTRDRAGGIIRSTPVNASIPPSSKPGSPSSTTRTSTVNTTKKLKTITEKAVPANKTVSGRTYFPIEPNADFRVVSIKIGEVFYVFQSAKQAK